MSLSVHALTFDCTNAADLARFWSDLLGRPVEPGGNEDFAMIGPDAGRPGGPRWMFIRVSEPKAVKNRVHVDLISDEWTAEIDRAIVLGATRLGDFDEDGATWTTLADPEGNEFDIAAPPE